MTKQLSNEQRFTRGKSCLYLVIIYLIVIVIVILGFVVVSYIGNSLEK